MIYFDNGATTKPFDEVVESFVKVATQYFGNPSSLHEQGRIAEQLLTGARKQIANLLDVEETEIIFTSGGTESNNLAIKGLAFQYENRGKHIITTEIEHASVKSTFEQLKNFGFEVTYLKVDSSGLVNLQQLKNELRDDTILVSVAHVNNEVGTIQQIKEIGETLEQYPNVFFHVDNVQGIGKVPLNLKESGVDLSSFSAHKFNGLKGNGILYKSESCQLSPLFAGGNQEQSLRSGTENVAGIVAMAKALRLTLEKASEKQKKLAEIKQLFISKLQMNNNVIVNTPLEYSAPHIVNFSLKGVKSETFIHALGEKNIFLSTTSACSSKKNAASKTLLAMGVDEDLASSAVRISISSGNSISEAEKVIKEIESAINKLKEVSK